jgi:hypothetical protein
MGRRKQRNRNRERWWSLLAEWAQYIDDLEDDSMTEDNNRLPVHYQTQPVTAPHQGDWARRMAEAEVNKQIGFQHKVGGWSIPKEEQTPRFKECGFFHATSIQLSVNIYAQISELMKEFPGTEWLAYMQANENGVFDALIVPEQVASGARVGDIVPLPADVRIDGVIHSHHVMKAWHSGTDDQHLVDNHPVSIVVGRDAKSDKLEFHGIRSQKLPCGGRVSKDATVTVLMPEQQAWLSSVIDRIKKAAVTTYSGYTAGAATSTPTTTPSGGREVTAKEGFDTRRWAGWSASPPQGPAVVEKQDEIDLSQYGY